MQPLERYSEPSGDPQEIRELKEFATGQLPHACRINARSSVGDAPRLPASRCSVCDCEERNPRFLAHRFAPFFLEVCTLGARPVCCVSTFAFYSPRISKRRRESRKIRAAHFSS